MTNTHNLIMIVLVLFPIVSICRADKQAIGSETDLQKAHLKIEGKSILSSTLENERGQFIALVSSQQDREVIIHRPSEKEPQPISEFITIPAKDRTVSLAPGKYRWNSIIVSDRNKSLKFSARNDLGDWFVLSQGATEILRIGAPLQQSLKVSRSGALLNFEYKLLGAGGEEYSPYRSLPLQQSEKSKTPELSIYKADKKISSGSFRYG